MIEGSEKCINVVRVSFPIQTQSEKLHHTKSIEINHFQIIFSHQNPWVKRHHQKSQHVKLSWGELFCLEGPMHYLKPIHLALWTTSSANHCGSRQPLYWHPSFLAFPSSENLRIAACNNSPGYITVVKEVGPLGNWVSLVIKWQFGLEYLNTQVACSEMTSTIPHIGIPVTCIIL